ncbi:MAG: hypothetical protein LC803_21285 [Acidobacteria bacterium]|nr:hypothetical protein [Acidobacteriota bacterium]
MNTQELREIAVTADAADIPRLVEELTRYSQAMEIGCRLHQVRVRRDAALRLYESLCSEANLLEEQFQAELNELVMKE